MTLLYDFQESANFCGVFRDVDDNLDYESSEIHATSLLNGLKDLHDNLVQIGNPSSFTTFWTKPRVFAGLQFSNGLVDQPFRFESNQMIDTVQFLYGWDQVASLNVGINTQNTEPYYGVSEYEVRDNLDYSLVSGDEIALWVYAEFEDGTIVNGLGQYVVQSNLNRVAVFFTGNLKEYSPTNVNYRVNVYKKL